MLDLAGEPSGLPPPHAVAWLCLALSDVYPKARRLAQLEWEGFITEMMEVRGTLLLVTASQGDRCPCSRFFPFLQSSLRSRFVKSAGGRCASFLDVIRPWRWRQQLEQSNITKDVGAVSFGALELVVAQLRNGGCDISGGEPPSSERKRKAHARDAESMVSEEEPYFPESMSMNSSKGKDGPIVPACFVRVVYSRWILFLTPFPLRHCGAQGV